MGTEAKIINARKLIQAGSSIEAACREVGIGVGTYYKYNRAQKKTRPYKKRKTSVTVTDLPSLPRGSGLFLVFGSAQALTEFAKGLQ